MKRFIYKIGFAITIFWEKFKRKRKSIWEL